MSNQRGEFDVYVLNNYFFIYNRNKSISESEIPIKHLGIENFDSKLMLKLVNLVSLSCSNLGAN